MNTGFLTKNCLTPLELLNLYFSDGQSIGNTEEKLWQKMNLLLSWDSIFNRNYQSDLCPLLYYIITKILPVSRVQDENKGLSSNDMVKDSIRLELKKHYYKSLVKNMLLLEELRTILTGFQKEKIDVVIIKGADLLERIYPDIALRPMGDIDLLIRPEDLQKAQNILTGLAYGIYKPVNQRKHPFHKIYIKFSEIQQFVVEIHWDLTRAIFCTKIDLKEVWKEASYISSSESESLRLSPMHYVLYLCWHGSRHGFERLIWLCDIALVIKNNWGDINWDLLQQQSIEWKINRPLCLSLCLINILLHHERQIEKYSFNGFEETICNYLVLKIQRRTIDKKDSQNIINLLSWLIIQEYRDKAKHLFFRWLETRTKI
jgi:Uncharacterised nucleotidyltransferase